MLTKLHYLCSTAAVAAAPLSPARAPFTHTPFHLAWRLHSTNHPPTHTTTNLPTHSPTHIPTHSPTHPLTHSLMQVVATSSDSNIAASVVVYQTFHVVLEPGR
jgi:hypothetical protein